MVHPARKRPAPSNHWSQIGRSLVASSQGMDRAERAAAVRETAKQYGLSMHTVQRYVVLAEFLNRLGIGEESAGRLAVGQTEILLRVWPVDPKAALGALRRLGEGKLSYKDAVAVERRARSVASLDQIIKVHASERPTGLLGAPDLKRWAQDWTLNSAVYVEPTTDKVFPFVQVQHIFAFQEGRIAFIDEGAVSSGPHFRYEFMSFARTVLAASALFDRVVVLVALRSTVDQLPQLLELCAQSVACRVFLDLDRFGSDEGESMVSP